MLKGQFSCVLDRINGFEEMSDVVRTSFRKNSVNFIVRGRARNVRDRFNVGNLPGGSALAEMATHVMYLGGHGEKTTSTLEFKDTVKARFSRRSESVYYGTSGMICIHNELYQDEEAGNDLGEKGMRGQGRPVL